MTDRPFNTYGAFKGSAHQCKPDPMKGVELALLKAEVCRACEYAEKVVAREDHPSQYTTKCKSPKCSRCSNVSLISGNCPEGKFTKHGLV